LSDLPKPLPVSDVHERLNAIFPEGTPRRAQCTWEIAAKTVFVMLYVGAVEGQEIWLRPDQVTRMTDRQAVKSDDRSRRSWTKESLRAGKGEIAGRWYAANTRESIRDDTIRTGLIPNNAVIEREGLATTSPAPRYALRSEFAALFDPELVGRHLKRAIVKWQEENLTAGALARIAMIRRGAIAGSDHVLVRFPNGDGRSMAPGPSSEIARAVVEDFATRYLEAPGVIFLSESRDKVVSRDDELAKSIGLNIEAQKHLPDIVLADLGPKHPLLVFVEVVASDGPMTSQRMQALAEVAQQAGFSASNVAFVTAYLDRSSPAFRKTVNALAWGTFVWFAGEPEHLLQLREGRTDRVTRLNELL